MKQPSTTPQILGRIPALAPVTEVQSGKRSEIAVARVAEAQTTSQVPHVTEQHPIERLQGQPAKQSLKELGFEQHQEARRISGELAKLYGAGAITGPTDPEARFYACLILGFKASYEGKKSAKE